MSVEDLDIDSVRLVDEVFDEIGDKIFHKSLVKVVFKNIQFTIAPYLDAKGNFCPAALKRRIIGDPPCPCPIFIFLIGEECI